MGAGNASVSNRNNRNLQRTPERNYWRHDNPEPPFGKTPRTDRTDYADRYLIERRARISGAIALGILLLVLVGLGIYSTLR